MLLYFFITLALIADSFSETPSGNAIQMMNEKYNKYSQHIKNKRYAILIDYSKSIFQKRLWVYDLKNKEVIINCHVSHAFKSGFLYPTEFSNQIGSEKTPRGTFVTCKSYFGKFGYSMRLHGLEEGLNSNSLKRFITFHPGDDLFWSDGCFMTDSETSKKIIDLTKNGCLMYVYGNDSL
jgi:hypothetical protein